MDTVGSSLGGQVPILENLPPHNEEGASGGHLYVPWWGYKAQAAGKLDFPRGYHIEFGGGRRMPDFDTLEGLEWLTGGSYGAKLKEDARRYYGSFVHFSGRGEMIPEREVLLRDRSNREGSVGNSGVAIPLAVVRARDPAGRPYAENVRRH